jgi:hypothetical protein
MLKTIRVIISVAVLLSALIALAGCGEENIADKLLLKQELSQDEQKKYAENKTEIDKIINDRLSQIADSIMVGKEDQLHDRDKAKLANNRQKVEAIISQKLSDFSLKIMTGVDLKDNDKKIRDRYIHRLQTEFVPVTEEKLRKEKKAAYKRSNGSPGVFDVSESVHDKFGFYPSDRINTKWGNATVIGILEDHLWFHIDGKKGASFWSTIDQTFKLLDPEKESKRAQQAPARAILVEKEKSSAQGGSPTPTVASKSSRNSGNAEGVYFEGFEPVPRIPYRNEAK